MVFYTLEPFGSEANYYGDAIVAATVANSNRPKGTKAAKAADYMPKFERTEQTPGQQIQLAAMLTEALGGKDLRED